MANTTITPNAGKLNLSRSFVIIAAVGALALAGSPPTVTQAGSNTGITPTTARLIVTSTQFNPVITPAAAVLGIAGQLPSVANGVVNVTIRPNPGALLLERPAAAIVPATGALGLSGFSVTQTLGLPAVPSGAVGFAGSAPLLAFTHVITPNSGALALAGLPPNVGTVGNIIVPTGAPMAFTGFAPSLTQTTFIGSALLSLAGQAPLVASTSNQQITPQTGAALGFAGQFAGIGVTGGQLASFPLTFSTGQLGVVIPAGVYNYATLLQAILDFSHRTDIANYQDYFIQSAELRIYKDLFAKNIGNGSIWLETPFSTTIGTSSISLPTGYLALKYALVLSGTGYVKTLLYKDPQWIYTNYPVRAPAAMPAYIARDGNQFVFGPSPDSNYTVQGYYYATLPPISATNPQTWMTTYIPDVFLAAAMIEVQKFLKDYAALKLWVSIYESKLDSAVSSDKAERLSPGTLTMELG